MISSNSSVSSFSYKPKLANLTSINHSQFSILNSMDRFMNCVEKMQATILVPSRLRDLKLENEQINLLGQSDAYQLYVMLNEIQNELLWGPTTGATSAAMIELSSNFHNLALTSHLSSTPTESSPIVRKGTQPLPEMVKCDSSVSLSLSDSIKRSQKKRAFSSNDDGFSSMHDGSSSSLSDDESLDVSSEGEGEGEDSETSSLNINSSSSSSSSLSSSSSSSSKNKLENQSSVERTDLFHLTAAFRLHLRGLSALCNQLADTAEFITEKYTNELN